MSPTMIEQISCRARLRHANHHENVQLHKRMSAAGGEAIPSRRRI
jgi:hypothetical protein